ncbi:GTPase HflX [Candidatus Blochmannia ocreatus]|uniref:GTPase HflX n=1 Tax=Candidatus Blochmannia ocreatus (nom. nud.) TaxID=251538 RepID=A0ABY4STF6_9ENTR|nr:GTPase HflX [Candidatus Blochmannia ocreatus]
MHTFFAKKTEDIDYSLQEFLSLAYTNNIRILNTLVSTSKVCYPKYFIGTGKALELKKMVKDSSVSIVLFNCILFPHQERNLTFLLQCKIIDRNQLILSIFAKHARTYEGKLQVRLAQLRYLNSRLVHEWSHLERQRGGIGLRGGSGEMQLENDRRLLRKEIIRILLRLKKIENQREQSRRHRLKIGIPTISLVGYTNAGKSTLFNLLTKSNIYTEQKLFSTLDPTCRRVVYGNNSNILLIDTVGFIQDLPKDLIPAFKTTLQETIESTLLLHIVDVTNSRFEQHIDSVSCILNSINAHNIQTLLVMNKIDQLPQITPRIDRDYNERPIRVWISSKEDVGIYLLMQALSELLSDKIVSYCLRIPISSNLFQKLCKSQVVQEFGIENSSFVRIKICVSSVYWQRLLKKNKFLTNYIIESI